MKKLPIRVFLFIAIPFILLEVTLRVIPSFDTFYQKKVNLYYNLQNSDGGKYCFIGTSRVAAAIVPEQINDSNPDRALNMGRGYTSGMIHYFGLKSALKKNPDCLQNSIVFIESPNGFCGYYGQWSDSWINADGPYQIVPYLDWRSVKKMWSKSDDEVSIKTRVSLYYSSRTVRYFAFFKELLGRNSFKDIVTKAGLTNSDVSRDGEVVMTERGGIKTDTASVAKARAYAKEHYGNLSKEMPHLKVKDWEQSTINDIRILVENAGGKLMMFEMPLSSVQKHAYSTTKSEENIKEFAKYREKYNIPYVRVPIETNDDDFPDLWHLSTAKANEFSKLLGQEINQQLVQLN